MTASDQTVLRGDPECTYKALEAQVAPSIDPTAAVDLACYMTVDTIDADGEVVLPGGGDFSRFDKNPILMLCHGYGQPGCYYPLPIGKVVWIKKRPHGVMAGVKFAQSTQMARDVKALFDEDMCRAFSIGFLSLEASLMTRKEAASRPDWKAAYERSGGKVLVHRRWTLLELSVAPLPSNEDALRQHYAAKGLSVPTWLQLPEARTMPEVTAPAAQQGGETVVSKAAVPFASCHDISEAPWNGDEDIAAIRKHCSKGNTGKKEDMDWAAYEKFFTWCDSSNPHDFGSYKMPHHKIENGKFVLLRKKLGMNVAELHGGRAGGLAVPESDLAGITAHLRKHYEEDLKEPFPEGKPSTQNVTGGKTLKCYGVGMKGLSVGDHVTHEKSGVCGRLKSIHTEGLHPRHSRNRDEGTIQATEDEPVGLIAEHDDDHDESGATRAHYMHHLSMVDDDGDYDGDEPTEKTAGRDDDAPFAVGSHVRHKASGTCGEVKSIHKSGKHTLGLEGDDAGREVEASEGEPVYRIALHNVEHKCHGPMSRYIKGMLEPHPEKTAKSMAEGSGTSGGYTVTGDAAGSPDSGENVTYDDETDEDDPHEEEGTAGYSRGDHVLVRAPHFHGKGVVKSFHRPKAPSLVRHAHNDLIASAAEPAALVHIHKEMSDGHVPTDLHVAAHLKHLKKLDAPLRLPSKVKVAVPVPASPGRKPGKPVERTVELAIPTVLSSDDEAARQAAVIKQGIEDGMKRVLGFLN